MRHPVVTCSLVYLAMFAGPTSFLIYTWALAGAIWIVVAAVALDSGGQLSRRPLQRRMA